MAKQLSSKAASFVEGLENGDWQGLFSNGLLMFYTGSQPASADAAATGTACVRFTQSALAPTKEVRATAVIDFTSTTGNCTVLTVAGISLISAAVVYASPSALATAVAANVNAFKNPLGITAIAASNTVTLVAPKNSGTRLNGLAVVCTVAAGTNAINAGDADNFGQTPSAGTQVVGVAAANCLSVVYPPVDGVCAKEATAWQGIAGSGTGAGYIGFTNSFTSGTQTVGWFRWYGSMDDPELTGTPTADSSKQYLRFDGTIGTDLTATGGTVVTFGATQTQNSWTHSTPLNQG